MELASPQYANLSAAGVASWLGISKSALYKGLKAGLVPRPDFRVGRFVRWSTKSLEEFVAAEAVRYQPSDLTIEPLTSEARTSPRCLLARKTWPRPV